MDTGMMWFDNSKTSLTAKIKKASDYYQKKHGKQPNLCLVHPTMLNNDGRITATFIKDNMTVRPYRPVLPGHIWIGIDDER